MAVQPIFKNIYKKACRYILKTRYYNLWEFCGINPHYHSAKQNLNERSIKNFEVVTIHINDPTLDEKLSTLEELQDYIRAYVSEATHQKPFLLQLYGGGRRTRLWNESSEKIFNLPASTGEPDLWEMFLEARRKQPHKSGFPDGKYQLKTLVHIRLGDICPLPTPWDTWIFYDRTLKQRSLKEYRLQSEFPALIVTDFYRFVKPLVDYFRDNTFAIQFSSDGIDQVYTRRSMNMLDRLKIPQKQKHMIKRHTKRYKRDFQDLRNIKGSISFIGETRKNTFNFIHSALTADLIVTAFPGQHTGVIYLNELYSQHKKPPIFIMLYKPNHGNDWEKHFSKEMLKSIIPVNIAAVDFDYIHRRLNELCSFPLYKRHDIEH